MPLQYTFGYNWNSIVRRAFSIDVWPCAMLSIYGNCWYTPFWNYIGSDTWMPVTCKIDAFKLFHCSPTWGYSRRVPHNCSHDGCQPLWIPLLEMAHLMPLCSIKEKWMGLCATLYTTEETSQDDTQHIWLLINDIAWPLKSKIFELYSFRAIGIVSFK